MELRAILYTIERSVAWHLASSFFSCYSQTGFVDSSFLHLLNHFKHYWTPFFLFFNRAGTNLMASFGPAHIPGIKPLFFFHVLTFLWTGAKQKAGPVKRISASELNRRAPFMAIYEHASSKTHIQITSSSPSWTSDKRMMIGIRDGTFFTVFSL